MSQAKTSRIDSELVASRPNFAVFRKINGQDRLFWWFVGISIVVHTLVLVISSFQMLNKAPPINMDEWSMDAEVVSDFDAPQPTKAALPQAEIKAEAKVPVQMLPQLPQKFSVKEEPKPEDLVPEVKAVTPPPKPAEAKVAKPEEKAPEVPVKTENKTDNQLAAAEILKRAALERLRAEQKTAKTMQAPEKDALARLGEALRKDGPTAGSAVAKGKMNAYRSRLSQAIRRNYAVPEALGIKGTALSVVLVIAVAENGDLTDLRVKEPSGNQAYDDDTVRAVRASVPLPRPPTEFVGQPIAVAFSPKGA